MSREDFSIAENWMSTENVKAEVFMLSWTVFLWRPTASHLRNGLLAIDKLANCAPVLKGAPLMIGHCAHLVGQCRHGANCHHVAHSLPVCPLTTLRLYATVVSCALLKCSLRKRQETETVSRDKGRSTRRRSEWESILGQRKREGTKVAVVWPMPEMVFQVAK